MKCLLIITLFLQIRVHTCDFDIRFIIWLHVYLHNLPGQTKLVLRCVCRPSMRRTWQCATGRCCPGRGSTSAGNVWVVPQVLPTTQVNHIIYKSVYEVYSLFPVFLSILHHLEFSLIICSDFCLILYQTRLCFWIIIAHTIGKSHEDHLVTNCVKETARCQ